MDYDCIYNPGLNSVEAITLGVAEAARLKEMVFCIAGLCQQHSSANMLVDHSRLDASPVSMDDVRALSQATVLLKDVFDSRKCAHVVSTDLQFGLVRAWEALTELGGFPELDKGLFRSREEAVAWLTAGD